MIDIHLSVHIIMAINHGHMTYTKTVPSWFLFELKSGPSYVKHTMGLQCCCLCLLWSILCCTDFKCLVPNFVSRRPA